AIDVIDGSNFQILLAGGAARTKRQRKATCCGVLGAASHRTTCSRSSAAKLTSGLILAMRTCISYWPQYVYLFMIHTTRKPAQRRLVHSTRGKWFRPAFNAPEKLFMVYLNGLGIPSALQEWKCRKTV